MSSAKPKKEAQQVLHVIYCGPNFPKINLNQFAVYTGCIPPHFEEHTGKCPSLTKLFVPIEDFARFQKAAAVKGTPESIGLNEVTQYIQGGSV